MTQRDLRVGNYMLNFLGEVFQVNATTILEWDNPNEFGRPKPILLSEEHLIKMGFVKNDEHEHPSFNEYILGRIEIGNFNDEYFLLEALDQAGIDVEIRFIHQLQNLYHALTQEELTLK